MNLKDQLHATLLRNYREAGRELGYWGRRFLRELDKKGGLATAKRMLQPRRKAHVAAGLRTLIANGRTDLSVEETALTPRFRSLFTAEELKEARHRLRGLPHTRHRVVSPEENYPDEVDKDAKFSEGSIRRVVVNAYERKPAARRVCIAKYGYSCAVCDMSFGKVYGPIGRHFIHIHHKKPLALRQGKYLLRPTIDLIPVCPNCHAMLHTQSPPLGIDTLREILKQHATLQRKNK